MTPNGDFYFLTKNPFSLLPRLYLASGDAPKSNCFSQLAWPLIPPCHSSCLRPSPSPVLLLQSSMSTPQAEGRLFLVLISSELLYKREAIQSSFTHPLLPRMASTRQAALQSLINPRPWVQQAASNFMWGQSNLTGAF